ncbi:MAG: MFS transporter [Oscillospiraceae bacterium]|jgi:Na+/melibiose symporter-like transporter|nr:MFS transporter [Oscillospiraceae bacterium]
MKNPLQFFFSDTAPPDHVPNRNLFAYAAGMAGQNMNYWYITNWFFVFCNDILRIPSLYTGIITSVSRVFDSINDPVIGAMLDRHRCRSGEKFRPYLLKLPVFIGIVSALLFVDFGMNMITTVVLILLLYLFWDVLYSVQDVSLWSLIAISSPLSRERARVAQWGTIGVGLGSGVVSLFPIFKGENFLTAFGVSERTMYALGGVVFAFLGQIISLSAHKMKEQVASEKPEENLWQSIAMIRHNKTLLLISLGRFLAFISLSVPQIHFFESSITFLKIDGGTAMFLYGLITMVPGSIFALLSVKAAGKIGGMKKLLVYSESMNIVLRIVCYFIGYSSMPRLICVMFFMALANIPTGIKDIAYRSLTSDSIDYVEWKTGLRTEGISFSVQNFISKIGSAVTLYLNGYLLHILKYAPDEKKYLQNPAYMKWQWPMFILGPLLGLVLYLIVILFIDDDKQKKEMIEEELRMRRAEKRSAHALGSTS